MDVRVKPSKEILRLIAKAIEKCGSYKNFSEEFHKNIYASIRDWKTGRNTSIKIFQNFFRFGL